MREKAWRLNGLTMLLLLLGWSNVGAAQPVTVQQQSALPTPSLVTVTNVPPISLEDADTILQARQAQRAVHGIMNGPTGVPPSAMAHDAHNPAGSGSAGAGAR